MNGPRFRIRLENVECPRGHSGGAVPRIEVHERQIKFNMFECLQHDRDSGEVCGERFELTLDRAVELYDRLLDDIRFSRERLREAREAEVCQGEDCEIEYEDFDDLYTDTDPDAPPPVVAGPSCPLSTAPSTQTASASSSACSWTWSSG